MKRYKIIALLLNILMGAGHIYIGKIKKAFTVLFVPFFILLVGDFLEQYVDYSLLVSMALVVVFYLYTFVDIWRSFPLKDSKRFKYAQWYYVLLFIAFGSTFQFFISRYVDLLPTRHFLLPSSSMNNTLFNGDYIVAIKKDTPKRGDITFFRNPRRPEVYFVKRLVALGGDEILYQDKRLFIHFHEGDDFIKQHYPAKAIHKIDDRLWVENPYKLSNPNILYHPQKYSIFFYLTQRENSMMKVYIKELSKSPTYRSNSGEQYNAFYKKVEQESYFLLGDNRDQSNDSFFFGSVPKAYIYGVLKNIYMNTKSWDRYNIKVR